MTKTVILLVLTLFLTTAAAGQGDIEYTGDENITELNTSTTILDSSVEVSSLKEMFNKQSGSIPGFAASLLGDQTVHINITGVDTLENSSIGLDMRKKKIEEIKWGEMDETTLEITISKQDLNEITNSRNPMSTASKMLENGEIEYETYTLANKIKFGLLSLFM